MTRERIERWSLALIAVFMLPTAIQGVFHFGSHVDHLDGLATFGLLTVVALVVVHPNVALIRPFTMCLGVQRIGRQVLCLGWLIRWTSRMTMAKQRAA